MKYVIIFILILSLCFLSCDPEELFRSAPIIGEININPDHRVVNPFDTVYAEVQATNPEEGALSYQWTVSPNIAPFIDPIDGIAIRWIAPTTGGNYTFKVEVSNSYKSAERTKSVKVVEAGVPLVKIIAPQDNDYFIRGLEMEIEAEAFHNNGINKVQLYARDLLISEKSGTVATGYTFVFTPDTSFLGETEIKIEALANFTLAVGVDSVLVNIEAILPGNEK